MTDRAPVERDRDDSGRALNSRPRDGLGRPLPRGATGGVDRAPEGVLRTPEETIREAQALLDLGRPFHAHEVFEDAWKSSTGRDQLLWRGLAQFAVGLTHRARGNAVGGERLLRRGVTTLAGLTDRVPYGLELDRLAQWVADGFAGQPPRLRD